MVPFALAPESVDKVWPVLEPGLRSVKETDSNVEWTYDSVRDALKSGRSRAVVVFDNGEPVGFFMGYPQVDGAFFIWAGYLENGFDLGEGFKHVEDFARTLGCNRLIFGTNRRGWERVARKHGFRPSYWEKEI